MNRRSIHHRAGTDMKITAFNGSPRAEDGNTFIIVESFLQGAQEAGARVEHIMLAKQRIRHCLGLYACFAETPGACILRDDMDILIPKLLASDIIILATPLFMDAMTGIMKTFLDRLRPLIDPHFEKDEQGESRYRNRYSRYPGIIVISSASYPEQTHFDIMKLLFRRIARTFHTEVLGEIYRGSAELLKYPPLVLRIPVDKYKNVVRIAGREMVQYHHFSDKTRAELERPMVPLEQYSTSANRMWDKITERIKQPNNVPPNNNQPEKPQQ